MSNFPDKDLIFAASRGDLPGAKAALAAGADPYFDNGKAIEEAIANGHLALVELFFDAKRTDWVSMAAIWIAAENGHPEIVDYLIKQGVDVNAMECKALQGAAFLGNVEVLDLLLAAGAHTNNKALKFAAVKEHEPIIDRLLAAGADLHAENDFCLRHAAARGNLPIIETLVRHGADPDAPCIKAAAESHAHLRAWMDRRKIEAFCEGPETEAARNTHILRSRI